MSTTRRTEEAQPTPTAQAEDLYFGRKVVTFRQGPVSGYMNLRGVLVCAGLVVALVIAFLTALRIGDYELNTAEVIDALRGQGDAAAQLVVRTWRLPRAVAAIALGAALAVSGAIFQTLTRNPLGSPDIIGFNAGAYAAATFVILMTEATFLTTATGSFAGGLATALAVYMLSRVRGTFRSFRLIIIGIGIAALLSSVTTWMIVKAEAEDAMQVAIWGAGSLNALTFREVGPAVAAIVVVLFILNFSLRPLRLTELGDDLAATLGSKVSVSRVVLIVLGVLLCAIAAATAGPISFVALAAPQIARRLVRSAGVPICSSAFMGALLLLVSDMIAQHIYPPSPLPVGVVTVSLGGGYFVWLLLQESKNR